MKCTQCGKETSNPKFCSSSCAATWNNRMSPKRTRRKTRFCEQCRTEQSKGQSKFCSSDCQAQYYHEKYISDWKSGKQSGIRGEYGISQHIVKYLRDKYRNRCSQCGWGETNPFTGNIPQEVEHIDGDYTNNPEENLTLLCPNCHALTATYKGANKGNGRASRRKYYVGNADSTREETR